MPYRQNFPIPGEIDPPKQCLQITIPNHPDWKAVIAGTLSELQYWYNWERTGDTSGAQCAAVWKEVFNSIDWSDMSCCCGEMIPPQYRYTDAGTLERSVDGGGTWVESPEYDSRVYSPQFPPIPGEPSLDKKCVAATGAALLVKEQVGDNLTDDMSRYTLGELITQWVTTVIQSSNPLVALVTVITNQIFALVIATLRPALTETVYHLFQCILYCNMGADISVNLAQWGQIRSDITAQIGGIAGVFLEHLVYLLGTQGMTNLIRSGAATEGDCSDCEACLTCAQKFTISCDAGTLVEEGENYLIIESVNSAVSGGQTVQIGTGDSAKGCYIQSFGAPPDGVGGGHLVGWSLVGEPYLGCLEGFAHYSLTMPCDVLVHTFVAFDGFSGGAPWQIKIIFSDEPCEP